MGGLGFFFVCLFWFVFFYYFVFIYFSSDITLKSIIEYSKKTWREIEEWIIVFRGQNVVKDAVCQSKEPTVSVIH